MAFFSEQKIVHENYVCSISLATIISIRELDNRYYFSLLKNKEEFLNKKSLHLFLLK